MLTILPCSTNFTREILLTEQVSNLQLNQRLTEVEHVELTLLSSFSVVLLRFSLFTPVFYLFVSPLLIISNPYWAAPSIDSSPALMGRIWERPHSWQRCQAGSPALEHQMLKQLTWVGFCLFQTSVWDANDCKYLHIGYTLITHF